VIDDGEAPEVESDDSRPDIRARRECLAERPRLSQQAGTVTTYEITLKAAVINDAQVLDICCDGRIIATVPIPLTCGVWEQTPPVELKSRLNLT
jgi:hypothetical protein